MHIVTNCYCVISLHTKILLLNCFIISPLRCRLVIRPISCTTHPLLLRYTHGESTVCVYCYLLLLLVKTIELRPEQSSFSASASSAYIYNSRLVLHVGERNFSCLKSFKKIKQKLKATLNYHLAECPNRAMIIEWWCLGRAVLGKVL